jgi:3',5'-nucleoside bisphosphate phosphatase
MMRRIILNRTDLHIHTWASDGTWRPEELLEKIREKGIKIFSITDHDEIKSSEEMARLTLDHDMTFIKGVEVAVTHQKREYHLTVYDYQKSNEFMNLIRWNDLTRLEYNVKFIELKAKEHHNISLSEYMDDYQEDRTKGGWKSLNYLLDKGIYRTKEEYFQALNRTDLTLSFKEPEEAIEILKKSGAHVFLAHPSYYYRGSVMPEIELMYWKEKGIDGIECITPYADQEHQIQYYKNFCNSHHLMISGGSDCHGDFLKRELGYPYIELQDIRINSLLEAQLKKRKIPNII